MWSESPQSEATVVRSGRSAPTSVWSRQRRIGIVAVVLICLVGGAAGWFFTHRSGPGSPAATGSVVAVDPGASTFDVTSPNHRTTSVKVTSATVLYLISSSTQSNTATRSPGSFSDIRTGERVTVLGTAASNSVTATEVQVLPAVASKP